MMYATILGSTFWAGFRFWVETSVRSRFLGSNLEQILAFLGSFLRKTYILGFHFQEKSYPLLLLLSLTNILGFPFVQSIGTSQAFWYRCYLPRLSYFNWLLLSFPAPYLTHIRSQLLCTEHTQIIDKHVTIFWPATCKVKAAIRTYHPIERNSKDMRSMELESPLKYPQGKQ